MVDLGLESPSLETLLFPVHHSAFPKRSKYCTSYSLFPGRNMIFDKMVCFLQYMKHLQDYAFSHKNDKFLAMTL